MNPNTLIDYIKIHIISLTQDLDKLHSTEDNFKFIEGAIDVSRHYLSAVEDTID